MTTPTDAGSAELVARLREMRVTPQINYWPAPQFKPSAVANEAADRIIALETRIRELEEASDPNVPGDILCKIISHERCTKIAFELGYPSVLEALEALALKIQEPNP